MRGRRSECASLEELLDNALAGRSGVVVLRGEAGVGKSALLGHVRDRAGGWQLAYAAGIESEMELAYSGLHQLCAPMLDRLETLPVPQRNALATVFGLYSGAPPDRFLVGLAALTLLAEAAERQPLVCIVDDAHWLDQASAQILAFVARRLLAERVVLMFGVRAGIGDQVLVGLPELQIVGLGESDARALLLDNVHGPLDARVCDQIIAESRGNPLALLELPRTWDVTNLAGRLGVPRSGPIASKVEQSFVERVARLPDESRLVVLAAAAEPLGDPVLLHRAVETLGLDWAATDPAVDDGLLTIRTRVEFAHPLIRSAAYRTALADDRYRVHRALAEVTDAATDPDRRAWHRAQATAGPDEEIAAELERSAGRAQSHGGAAAAAAFLQRAAALSVDPSQRAERALAAAEASLEAGAFEAALALTATAEAVAPDEFRSARIDLLRGRIAFASGSGGDRAVLLLRAARRLEPFDLPLARETYLTAWRAAGMAGRLAGEELLIEICSAIQALPTPVAPRPLDMLLDGLALLTTEGRTAAAPALKRAASAFADMPPGDVLRWGWVAAGASDLVWDIDGMHAISTRQVQLAREAGAIGLLPMYLAQHAIACTWVGDFGGAAALISQADGVVAATGSHLADGTDLRLRALEGSEVEAAGPIARAIEQAEADGGGNVAAWAYWAAAVLYNGLSRYDEAASAARKGADNPFDPWNSTWALPELVEAAARRGDNELALEAVERLAETTRPFDNDAARGIEARSRALVSSGEDAGALYREAIERLARTGLRPDLARTHLVYGEWLRREGQRVNAREQLRKAHDMLETIGMHAFAERARRELLASGGKARKRTDETRDDLTPQEEQIAQLARDGLSNPEIGAILFLSPRTVEWHLRKVFAKLQISSRRGLRAAMPTTRTRSEPGMTLAEEAPR